MTAETSAAGAPFARTRGRPARRRRWDLIAAVGLGGTLGTLARYELSVALPSPGGGFPWAIFAVNVVGALILGAVTTLVLERWPPTRYVRPLVGIGFCGGLTTFSTWMVDATQLVDNHHVMTAVGYLVGTLVAGLVALYVGVAGVRVSNREARP
jgi:CrcB protein